MTKRRFVLLIALAICTVLITVRWAISRVRPPHVLGVDHGRLAACPDRPNCVSTQAENTDSRLDPIPLSRSLEEARRQIDTTLRSMPRTRIVSSGDGYLHAESRSLWLGFVDDVEFAIDESAGLIHFRSASRVGYSDLGVNRERMEEFRARFEGEADH